MGVSRDGGGGSICKHATTTCSIALQRTAPHWNTEHTLTLKTFRFIPLRTGLLCDPTQSPIHWALFSEGRMTSTWSWRQICIQCQSLGWAVLYLQPRMRPLGLVVMQRDNFAYIKLIWIQNSCIFIRTSFHLFVTTVSVEQIRLCRLAERT
jgi:hypothetical protein